MNTPINDGGPAFPLISEDHRAIRHIGMSLRDYFAAAALQALAAQKTVHLSWPMLAERAYFAADLMLAERLKTKETQS